MSTSEDWREEWIELDGSDEESDATPRGSMIEEAVQREEEEEEEDTSSDAQLAFLLAVEEMEREELYNKSTRNESQDDEDEDLQLALAMSMQSKSNQRRDVGEGSSRGATMSSEDVISWSGTVRPSSLFAAHWQAHIDGVEEENIRLDPWGDRVFLPSECDGVCIHRKLIQLQAVHGGESPRYSIRTSHLRAPSEPGHWSERWRLRDPFGSLVGPILEVKVNVSTEAEAETFPNAARIHSRETRKAIENASESNSTILRHEPFQVADQHAYSVNAPFQYVWQLQNSGQCSWTTPLSMSRANSNDVDKKEKVIFAITNLAKKMITGPVQPGMIINLILSSKAPDVGGIYEEVWTLSSASAGVEYASSLPLVIRVVEDDVGVRGEGRDQVDQKVKRESSGSPCLETESEMDLDSPSLSSWEFEGIVQSTSANVQIPH